ncbi:AI-2E family transporter [Wolbachia endosymbiont of Ostrinia furnacalis]|uniref:AI-2E family transporter n=1 Tax=Wolbachia endosymbiont of Ostrinia furnacalis TaxID=154048 RepID=UPI00201FF53F|nr:AI-2E family transporter [Wolbachia endosymbiont of Ostrinia furnacalis]URG40044.1 AI-2E family transporter [Wolbachia endosymbiont of Ostrinia furnacalis]
MSYTREQLKEARQAKSSLEKKFESKLELAIAIALALALGVAAVTGALAGLALSYVNLPPLIAGGIIGSAMLLVCCVISACSFSKTTNLNDIPESMSEENKQILREYSNSAEYKIKNYAHTISSIGVFFGVGAGLVALGVTSPAAIGALTFVVNMIPCISLNFLIDKAIECFFPEGNRQPSSSVDSDVKIVDGDTCRRVF